MAKKAKFKPMSAEELKTRFTLVKRVEKLEQYMNITTARLDKQSKGLAHMNERVNILDKDLAGYIDITGANISRLETAGKSMLNIIKALETNLDALHRRYLNLPPNDAKGSYTPLSKRAIYSVSHDASKEIYAIVGLLRAAVFRLERVRTETTNG